MSSQHDTSTQAHGTAAHHVANAIARLALTGFPAGVARTPAAAFTVYDVQRKKTVVQDDDQSVWHTTTYPTATWKRDRTEHYGRSAADVDLSGGGSTAIMAVTLTAAQGFAISSIYTTTLRVRVTQYTAADHAVAGSIDIDIDVTAVTDGTGIVTCTFQTAPAPDVGRLPAAMAGATATVAPSAGGFTISATQAAALNSFARASWSVERWENVTA